jgi:hypothetical protein
MTLKDLKDLDKDDLLKFIGLQTRRDAAEWILPTIAVFGVGVLVGAGVGLLLAPKPGRELREDLRKRLEGGSEQMGQRFSTEAASSDQARAAS